MKQMLTKAQLEISHFGQMHQAYGLDPKKIFITIKSITSTKSKRCNTYMKSFLVLVGNLEHFQVSNNDVRKVLKTTYWQSKKF